MNTATRQAANAAATLRDPRWARVLARDASADGTFYYSVRSTGVYCRPSCAARPARPENVAFHDSVDAAARAGFRACKRCRPDQPAPGAAADDLRYGVAASALGQVLVALGRHGVREISLGDDAQALVGEVLRRFPRACAARESEADFAAVMAKVLAFVDAPRNALDLPLDVRGTPFQQRVWQALRALPPGATASYAEVARSIGAPSAVRAVAQACAANALAVAIPCHRVLRSDGTLSGYRWGVARKRALLAREARA